MRSFTPEEYRSLNIRAGEKMTLPAAARERAKEIVDSAWEAHESKDDEETRRCLETCLTSGSPIDVLATWMEASLFRGRSLDFMRTVYACLSCSLQEAFGAVYAPEERPTYPPGDYLHEDHSQTIEKDDPERGERSRSARS